MYAVHGGCVEVRWEPAGVSSSLSPWGLRVKLRLLGLVTSTVEPSCWSQQLICFEYVSRIRTRALHICLRISDSHVLCNNTLFSQRLNAYMKVVPQDDTGSRKFLQPVTLQLAHCSLKHVTLEVTTLWTDLAPCQPHSRYHDITQNRATDLCISYLYFSRYCWTHPIHLSNRYCRISCHVLMAIAVHSSCSEGAPSKCVKVHSIVSA